MAFRECVCTCVFCRSARFGFSDGKIIEKDIQSGNLTEKTFLYDNPLNIRHLNFKISRKEKRLSVFRWSESVFPWFLILFCGENLCKAHKYGISWKMSDPAAGDLRWILVFSRVFRYQILKKSPFYHVSKGLMFWLRSRTRVIFVFPRDFVYWVVDFCGKGDGFSIRVISLSLCRRLG